MKKTYNAPELEIICLASNERLANNEQLDYDQLTGGLGGKGSSIIGDGLAAACLDFYDYEEKPDRTRVIILSTDNEL